MTSQNFQKLANGSKICKLQKVGQNLPKLVKISQKLVKISQHWEISQFIDRVLSVYSESYTLDISFEPCGNFLMKIDFFLGFI